MATVPKKLCMVAGCPTMLENLEDILYDFIFDMRIKIESNENFLRAQASNFAVEYGIQEFKGYSSRKISLIHRLKLSLRRITNLKTLTDYQLIQRAVEYMTFLRTTLPEISLGKIFLMGETTVFFEDFQTQTIYF